MNVRELHQALDALRVDPRFYDLEGLSPAASEGIVLEHADGCWKVASFERNRWYVYGEFEREDDACALMLRLLSEPDYRQQPKK